MYYSANVYNPVIGMEKIVTAASKFNIDRFLYAMQYKNWDEPKIMFMSKEVADYRSKLEDEYKHLVEFSKVFNKEFATMNNKCFSSALTMLHKLRSGIRETKRLFLKFCPRARQERVAQIIHSAYDYAYISSDNYQLELFKFDGYPACVNGLYNEMEKFFILLIKCMKLCQQVIKDEEKIRSDNKYCKFLLEEFKKKILKEVHDIIFLFSADSENLSEARNPAIASRNRYENDEAWAPVGFHKYSKTEVKLLIIKQLLDEERESNITKTEMLLFGNDQAKVEKYRYIIQHFEELLPENYSRKKLPAMYIQMFFQFVGIQQGSESSAVNYFNEKYLSSPNPKFGTVSYQAVNGCKKEVSDDKDGCYTLFIKNIKRHFFCSQTSQTISNF